MKHIRKFNENNENSRTSGYYWCKLDGTWDIFNYSESSWDYGSVRYDESDFEEIDENRIVR